MASKNIVTYHAIKQAFKRVGGLVLLALHLCGNCWWSLDWFTRIAFGLAAGYGYGMLTLAAQSQPVVMAGLMGVWTGGLVGLALWRGWQAHVMVWSEPIEEPEPVRYPCTEEDYQRDLERVQQLRYPVLRIEPSALPGIVHHYYINLCEVCQREFNAGVVASKRLCVKCAMWQEGSAEREVE